MPDFPIVCYHYSMKKTQLSFFRGGMAIYMLLWVSRVHPFSQVGVCTHTRLCCLLDNRPKAEVCLQIPSGALFMSSSIYSSKDILQQMLQSEPKNMLCAVYRTKLKHVHYA